MSQVVLNVIAENEEKPHISKHMPPTLMEKHRSEEGENQLRETGMRVPYMCWNEGELVEECFQSVTIKRYLEEKHEDIQPNQEPVHVWRAISWLVIFDREHDWAEYPRVFL